MQQYLNLLNTLLCAPERADRTGVGTRGIFGHHMRFPLHQGFPLLTTKKMFMKGIIYELFWFLDGDTNIKYLQDNGVHIWDEWADEYGDLGPVYGKQWRAWPGEVAYFPYNGPEFPHDCAMVGEKEGGAYLQLPVDQITNLVNDLKSNPFSRRHMVSAWNPADINKMKLPPCHCLFQCYVRKPSPEEVKCFGSGKMALDLQLYQRSADTFLGVPFNIASYSLLLMMLAQVCGLIPGEFLWTGGDVHLYSNHIEQAKEQVSRGPMTLPVMVLNPGVTDIFDFTYSDFELRGYVSYPPISAEVAV